MKPRTLVILTFTFLFFSSSAQNIHRTACSGNLQRLDSMLQYTELHVPDFRGRSLLHWAVGCDQKEVFDNLIERGININWEDSDGNPPLYIAVQYNRVSFLDTLILLQQNDNWKSKYGASLLERAILDKNLSLVQKLIAKGVNIEILNQRGSSPLEISIRIGAEEISNWLMDQGADKSQVRTITMNGDYIDTSLPEKERRLFAPNYISTEEHEFGAVFNADRSEFYYAIDDKGKASIRYSKRINNNWSKPVTILGHEQYGYNDPFLSPDENRLYFISKRPLDGVGEPKDYDIWYVEKENDEWSQPINAGSNINSKGDEYYISFTSSGTMYFASNIDGLDSNEDADHDIYYSTYVNGAFQEAVALGDSINTDNYEADVFVAPDESYLIYCSTRPDGLGRGDLYISFKSDDGWSKAVNMGETVNSRHHELCPYVTADGKYLIYTSNGDIYWISTEIFDQYR